VTMSPFLHTIPLSREMRLEATFELDDLHRYNITQIMVLHARTAEESIISLLQSLRNVHDITGCLPCPQSLL